MGLLDAYQPQQPQAQQPQGGLLGGMAPQGAPQAAAPQAGGGMQMLQQLMQNPTPQAAQAMAQQLQAKGPEGQKMAQALMSVADDPEGIKNFANMVMQHLQQPQ